MYKSFCYTFLLNQFRPVSKAAKKPASKTSYGNVTALNNSSTTINTFGKTGTVLWQVKGLKE